MSNIPHPQGEQTTQRNPGVENKYQPGKQISVGIHQVEILNYIAEGGFAQIYSVKFVEYLNEFGNDNNDPNSLKAGDIACLKRVIVHDENGLNELRNEVDVMKKLKGAPNIVQYYDSNASRLHNNSTGFEILLLMELCPNGSLLDYMNQRLATKLSEQEILKIMYDITLALSHMHYLTEPLLHRDIKIENVLVDSDDNFKLCDFGSTSKAFHVVTTHQEIAMLTQNIYVHTTPQYRSPEMIDLYRYLPVNEKSDIWALGVLLYKLLFFTTPFEMTGQFAILHSKYEIPQNKFSSKLNNLIIIMLSENPNLRPNIYQVLYQICSISGITVPINDIYEAGPYNFENYTHFQSKIQSMQFQMFEIEKKKAENHGKLGPAENKMLNNIFMNSFDIASKISFPGNEILSKQATVSKEQSFPKENPQDKLTSTTPDAIAQKSVHSQDVTSLNEMEEEFKDATNGAQGVRNKLNEMALKEEGSYYPSVGELNQFIDNDISHVQNNNSENITQMRFPDINQAPVTTHPEILDAKTSASSNKLFNPMPQDSLVTENTMNTYMQHKSTNPFPNMSNDPNSQQVQKQNDFGSIPNPVSINNQQLPRTYPSVQTPVDSINYLNNQTNNVDSRLGQQSNKEGQFNINDPQQPRSMMQFPPSGSPINVNVDYIAAANSQDQFKRAYNQFKGLTGVGTTQGSPTANIQQNVNSPVATRVQSQQQQQVPLSTTNTPSPAPPVLPSNRPRSYHPNQNSMLNKSSSSDESLPPKVPPHPRKNSEGSKAMKDVDNLRDHKTGKLKLEQVDVNVDTRHTHRHPQHNRSHRNSVHDNVGVRRSVSMSNKPKMLLERPTTESIDIDLDKLKRKSLDLKMQKSGFVSDLKDQSIQENEISAHQQNMGSGLNHQRLSKQNVSNGSIPNSASNTDEIKKSITRARQSLDLDRARREALLSGDNNKRKSLFSMFRADKK
ncbi:hypothetical protein C6P45_002243 [Maudiozyma exigua]|uniref:Protein kinase domain-containing protein n=1 Tax=Maudiozyma exigua TaxID=34358 RepID=A0A9P6WCS2_MAUEX|nr:hypothetical protein C6P45_002243 [Kazachstania exigua]